VRDLGYVDGRDYVLEERYADSVPERLPGIIAELQQLNVALFLSPGSPYAARIEKQSIKINGQKAHGRRAIVHPRQGHSIIADVVAEAEGCRAA
jgi:hypothetical protein